MKVLFLILARGGSKGLPGKNCMPLLGKPLIAYSIECAMRSKYYEEVIVSTDDDTIAETARSFGALVPFRRPAELASDTAKSSDAVLHTFEYLEKQGKVYSLLVLLEPTSPLRDVRDIDKAIETLEKTPEASFCVSVTKAESAHPSFLFIKDKQHFVNAYLAQDNVIRRQDLSEVFYPEGSFYIAKVPAYKAEKTFYKDGFTIGYELPKWQSFEIDTKEDFYIVEAILLAKNNNKFN